MYKPIEVLDNEDDFFVLDSQSQKFTFWTEIVSFKEQIWLVLSGMLIDIKCKEFLKRLTIDAEQDKHIK